MVPRPPLVLNAVSLDRAATDLLASGARLRVHSVFGRALNLVSAAGDLLGLVGPHAGGAPATIVLDRLPAGGFDALGLTADVAIDATPDWLWVGPSLQIDLRRARVWEPTATRRILPTSYVLARVAQAEATAAGVAPPGGLAPLLAHLAALAATTDLATPGDFDPLNRAAWAGLIAVLPAWRRGDVPGVGVGLSRLVGLGPGSTPSGDDLVAGLLVATRRVQGTLPDGLAETCLAVARGRTTDLAIARIGHAARGLIEEALELVLVELLAGTGADLEAAIERAARLGHTSGIDTLVGLFLGLRLSLERRSG